MNPDIREAVSKARLICFFDAFPPEPDFGVRGLVTAFPFGDWSPDSGGTSPAARRRRPVAALQGVPVPGGGEGVRRHGDAETRRREGERDRAAPQPLRFCKSLNGVGRTNAVLRRVKGAFLKNLCASVCICGFRVSIRFQPSFPGSFGKIPRQSTALLLRRQRWIIAVPVNLRAESTGGNPAA